MDTLGRAAWVVVEQELRASSFPYPIARRVSIHAMREAADAAARLSLRQTRRWWVPVSTEASPTTLAVSAMGRNHSVATFPATRTTATTSPWVQAPESLQPPYGMADLQLTFKEQFTTMQSAMVALRWSGFQRQVPTGPSPLPTPAFMLRLRAQPASAAAMRYKMKLITIKGVDNPLPNPKAIAANLSILL